MLFLLTTNNRCIYFSFKAAKYVILNDIRNTRNWEFFPIYLI
jgi:hypothetical protein